MKKNSPDDVYSLIVNEIIDGSLKPQEVVTENFLAKKYGLSRTPVREALNRLQCEGLIYTTGRTKRIYSLSVSDIREIFDLKKLIEGNVAENAARNISKKQSDELKKIVAAMQKLNKNYPKDEYEAKEFLGKWLELDRQFHELLFSIAENERAQHIIEKLNIQWHRFKVGLAAMEGRVGYAIPEHQAIALAVIEKNYTKARHEMTAHLENLKSYIIRLMVVFG